MLTFARLIAVAERGLGNLVREVAVTVRTPENLVLGVNPTGKVPCLVVEDGPEKGLVFLESSLICEYLEEHGDAPPLLPGSAPGSSAGRRGRSRAARFGAAVTDGRTHSGGRGGC